MLAPEGYCCSQTSLRVRLISNCWCKWGKREPSTWWTATLWVDTALHALISTRRLCRRSAMRAWESGDPQRTGMITSTGSATMTRGRLLTSWLFRLTLATPACFLPPPPRRQVVSSDSGQEHPSYPRTALAMESCGCLVTQPLETNAVRCSTRLMLRTSQLCFTRVTRQLEIEMFRAVRSSL